MCFIINNPADDVKTADTLLVVAPLATPSYEPQKWQLIYINSISVGSPNGRPLMVVPLPNPHGMSEHDFTLFALSHTSASAIVRETDRLALPYYPDPKGQHGGFGSVATPAAFGAAFGRPPPLMVQQAGDYKISVAPTMLDLESRAPWSAFNVHPSHARLILADMREKYGTGFAFVIAEGVLQDEAQALRPFSRQSVTSSPRRMKQSGFGVMYRDGRENGCFFPTSHEVSSNSLPVGVPANHFAMTVMDVTCVGLGVAILPGSILPDSQLKTMKLESIELSEKRPVDHVILRADDSQCVAIPPKWDAVRAILEHLPRRGAAGRHREKYVQHERIHLVSMWRLAGQYPNLDVCGRKTVDCDVSVVSRLMDDFNIWAASRLEPTESVDSEGNVSVPRTGAHSTSKREEGNSGIFGSQFNFDGKQGSPFGRVPEELSTGSAVFGARNWGGSDESSLSQDGSGRPSPRKFPSSKPLSERVINLGTGLNKLDLALALLARQLAYPGRFSDRFSDVSCRISGEPRICGSVSFLNLDLPDLDLDEHAYREKRGRARFVGHLDTSGSTYLRLSPTVGPWESLEERTV